MLNDLQVYDARDSIQCVPTEPLKPFSLNERRERTAFIFYVEPLTKSRTQCPSQENNKFCLRQNHEPIVFNGTTSTRENKEKSEDLKVALHSYDYPTMAMTAPSHAPNSRVCSHVCVCVLAGHLLHDLYPLTVPDFCGPSRYTGNQMCGHVTTVFTSTLSKLSSAQLLCCGGFFLFVCTYGGSAFGFNAPRWGDTQVMNSVQMDTL